MHPACCFVFLTLLPTVTFAKASERACGRQAEGYEPSVFGRKLTRIIGGGEAKNHSWPWQVRLQKAAFGAWDGNCGASLVRVKDVEESDILVTAAHCVSSRRDNRPVPFEPYQLRALLGAHNERELATGQQNLGIAKILIHSNYTPSTMRNDVALLKLKSPVNFTDTIRPICLPEQGDALPVGKPCAAAGWGRVNSKTQEASNVLKQLVVPVHNGSTCLKNEYGIGWSFGVVYVEDEMVCAGPLEGGSGVCTGDSGGMLACQEVDGRYTLYGAASYAFPVECIQKGFPGVFTRVSTYVNWIKREMWKITSVKGRYELDIKALADRVKPRPVASLAKVPASDEPLFGDPSI